MQLLDKKGVQIVDTTCPWVSKVWTAVEKHRSVRDATPIYWSRPLRSVLFSTKCLMPCV